MIARLIKPGGYIIANNYTHWAHEVNAIPGMVLVGAIFPYYGLPNAQYIDSNAEAMQDDPTALVVSNYKIDRDGKLSDGTADSNTLVEIVPKYPDALFVFICSPN